MQEEGEPGVLRESMDGFRSDYLVKILEWGQIPSFSKWWARIPRVSKVTVQITWVCNISGQITWATFSPNCAKSGPDYLEDQITWSRPKAGQITWARPKWAGRFPGRMVFFSATQPRPKFGITTAQSKSATDLGILSLSIYLSIPPFWCPKLGAASRGGAGGLPIC